MRVSLALVAVAVGVATQVTGSAVAKALSPALPSGGRVEKVKANEVPVKEDGHGQPADAEAYPVPFTRRLELQTPPLTGRDVYLLRGLMARVATEPSSPIPSRVHEDSARSTAAAAALPPCASVAGCPFDAATAAQLRSVQRALGVPSTGVFDPVTAEALLRTASADHFAWNGTAPETLGYKYLVRCPVSANRSVETTCTLHAGNGTSVYSFTARLHGASVLPPPAWPSFNSSGAGVNQFTSDGCTPTGLTEFDLNSPEDEPKEFGPYPVNRATVGLEGNFKLLLTNTADTPRGGILMHTGEWTCCGWKGPPAPMPNSIGCIHAYPESIEAVWKLLTEELGVTVRENTNGKTPYPYKSQGLLAVELTP